jgi:transcriptional regulator with XRE-family HTH domain
MTSIKKLLGSNIKTYRHALGISQEKLAEMADTATNYLGLIEGGKKFPSAEMIERIAAALDKDPPDLFAITPIQQKWKDDILAELEKVIQDKLETQRCTASRILK